RSICAFHPYPPSLTAPAELVAADFLDADVGPQKNARFPFESGGRVRAAHQGLLEIADRQMVSVQPVLAAHGIAAKSGVQRLSAEADMKIAGAGHGLAVDGDHRPVRAGQRVGGDRPAATAADRPSVSRDL